MKDLHQSPFDLAHPINQRIGLQVVERFSEKFPGFIWWRFGKTARALGLDRLYVVFSFDCDTAADIGASEAIYHEFKKADLKMSLCVPGEQLREGQEVYRSLAKRGVPFLNHGFRAHAVWAGDHYQSTTFYHQMTPEEIVEDVRLGHDAVVQTTRVSPKGFRTPHFGLFQKSWQIRWLHQVLHELGYEYSSSTGPIYSLLFGNIWQQGKILEIPLSGSYRSPLSVLDSWSFVRDPREPIASEEYGDQLSGTLARLSQECVAGILCYYGDPSHIAQSESYRRVLSTVATHNILTLYFDDVVAMLRRF